MAPALAHVTLTHGTRGGGARSCGVRRRAACGVRRRAVCVPAASATAAPAPTRHAAPTATGCLISHYNLRVARFLPLLLPRFVLRIIECIPLAPAAMRAERRPDNSRVQLRRSRSVRRALRTAPSVDERLTLI